MKAALVVVMVLSGTAYAEDAVELFNEGIKQMKAANYEKACPALKRSNELKPDSGTRGSLAKCYDKQGKTASSWKLWVDLSTTAPAALRADAAANAAKIEPRVPKYILHFPPGSPANVQIMIDGVIVESTPEVPVPIDPGHYHLAVEAADYNAWKTEFDAKEGVTTEINIDIVAKKKIDDGPKPIVTPPVEGPTPKSSRKKIGFVLTGVGGAALIGGVVMGVIAKGRNDDAKDICGGDIDACDPAKVGEAQDKVDSARTAGTISTVGVIAGGALVVTGIVLIVTAPKAKQVAFTPTVSNDGVGFAFTRAF